MSWFFSGFGDLLRSLSYPHPGAKPRGSGPIGCLEAIPARIPAFRGLVEAQSGMLLWVVEIDVAQPGSTERSFTPGRGVRPAGTFSITPQPFPEAQVLGFSDIGYGSLARDPGGVKDFPAYVRTALTVDRTFNLEPHQPQVGFSWGSIVMTEPGGYWSGLVGSRSIDGQRVRVYIGSKSFDDTRGLWTDPAYRTLTKVFEGVATNWFLGTDSLEIPVRDRSFAIEVPWQSSTYTGVGGLNGTADMAGKPKPKLRGQCANITPVMVDPTARIYQYNDAQGQVLALYEAGAEDFTYAGDVADLYSGSTPSGQYRTDNARGLFQLGADPVGEITLDAKGWFVSAGYRDKVVEIALYTLIDDLGIDQAYLDMGGFTGLASVVPYVGGIYANEVQTGDWALGFLLGSLGGSLLPNREGRLRPYRLTSPAGEAPVATYTAAEIVSVVPRRLPDTLDPPNYRRLVGYARNWTVQTSGLKSTVTATRRQQLALPYSTAGWSDSSVLLSHRRPTDPPMLETALRDQADAQAVADQLGALWGTRRRIYDVTLWLHPLSHDIGQELVLSYPIEDLAAGKVGVVVGESIRSSETTITLQVLV